MSPLSTSVKVPACSGREKSEPTVALWLAVWAASTGASLAPWMVTVSEAVEVAPAVSRMV